MRAIFAAVGAALALVVGAASAHTVSIGYANAGPGAVTFWFGTYHQCTESPPTEGSFNVVGVNGTVYPSTTVPFSLTTSSKPAGLIDGTTNFYATNAGPLANTDVDGLGPVVCWQGVTFNGLAVGSYKFTYIPVASPTVKWAPWNTQVTTNTANLSQGVVQGTPAAQIPTLDPMMLGLLALMIAAMALLRRRAR
jgi:fibronectin-binding autotransporter adhesin